MCLNEYSMIMPNEIELIHRELATIYNRGKILFGGSYLYGEAIESSDLDFYLICNFCDFFYYKKRSELISALKLRHPEIKVMLVTKLFFKFGWYYVYGRNLDGKIEISRISKKIVFRNCLKLACFHYLSALLSDNSTEKGTLFRKSATQTSVALIVGSLPGISPVSQPIFSREFIDKCLSDMNDLSADIFSGSEALLSEAICDLFSSKSDLLSFSLANYLIYNIKFILRGNFTFLTKNPDKYILSRMISALKKRENLMNLHAQMKEIIFPVHIL